MPLKNAPKRNIASAIDLLEQDYDFVVGGVRFTELPIKQIQPYHDHRFHLYEGQRLEDMVESIQQHGVLNPVIVLRLNESNYEMLSGHNRLHAAQLVGLTVIPALVKEGLTEDEALAYVIETNLIQRSFTDMKPSEQAAVLQLRFSKLTCQGRRNDILRELHILETGEDSSNSTCALIEHKLKTRDKVGEEYGLAHASVARLLRLNELIEPFREMVDKGILPLYAAVDLSYLPKEAQQWVLEASQTLHYPLNMKNVKVFREQPELTRDLVYGLIQGAQAQNKPAVPMRKISVPKQTYERYFKDKSEEEVQSVLEQALQAWYERETE